MFFSVSFDSNKPALFHSVSLVALNIFRRRCVDTRGRFQYLFD